jgi:hypothetical protein
MLAKAKGDLQAISASRLRDGTAVWWDNRGRWVENVGNAAVLSGEAIAAGLAAAKADIDRQVVVDVYPLDVRVVSGRPEPVHVRERIKALGPSVGTDFGSTDIRRSA